MSDLRDRYLMQGLFQDGQIVLTYNHAERFVVGGVVSFFGIRDVRVAAEDAAPLTRSANRAGVGD